MSRANTNTGITATAPSQLELISAFLFFFPLLGWTDSGTDGLVCCVTVFFLLFPPAARPPTAKITSRHLCFTEPSDLAADYLYFLSRCELASVIVSQVSAKRRRPICEQGMQVMSRAGPVSFYPAPKSHRCCRITRPQKDKRRRCFIFKEINVCSSCNSRIKES